VRKVFWIFYGVRLFVVIILMVILAAFADSLVGTLLGYILLCSLIIAFASIIPILRLRKVR
jgi:hypothetical protein